MELVVPAVSRPVHRSAVAALLQQCRTVLDGVPFFYWYQLLWVLISAVITAVIYLATEK